jgi:hypothetical protein
VITDAVTVGQLGAVVMLDVAPDLDRLLGHEA